MYVNDMEKIRQLTIQNNFKNSPEFPLRGFFNVQVDMAPHRQEFTEIVFILHHRAEHYTEPEGWAPLRRGDVWIIPPGGVHGFRDTARTLELFNLLFVADKLPAPLLDLYTHPGYKRLFLHRSSEELRDPYPYLHLTPAQTAEMESLLKLFAAFSGNPPGQYGLFMAIVSSLCRLAAKGDTGALRPFDIRKVQHYLRKNYAMEITVDDLCRLTALSASALHRHFRRAFGVSPMKYLCRERLAAACRLLLDSSLSVKEIAQLTGFADPVYFIRVFRENCGCTPGAYRRRK
ncbi:MAG: helix-turn-helix domain-containing protein [Lentisphaeria bacterium]|nr:helix-turn-helix domain-containing protein [Lentisphaeria bacterium]